MSNSELGQSDQNSETSSTEASAENKTKAVPISRDSRRVLGVLVEKAKTTPDSYPLTLSALVSGCNQKSNREPKLQLDDNDVLNAIDDLKQVGAVREVQGSGRATKYRHAAYEWLSVESPGAAIMTELLLRGPQTLGELRTRASRMYAFDDLNAAREVVEILTNQRLVEPLTPPGRGQTFAHTLYPPDERQYLEARLEKQEARKASAEPKSSANRSVVDSLIARLDSVTERIDQLEKRIEDLES